MKTMASSPITLWQIDGEKVEAVTDFIFSRITADHDCNHETKTLVAWKESYDKSRQHIKKQRHHFANKGLYSQNYGFSSSHVWMWEVDHKEGWALKNWCFWTVVLEKTLGSPSDCKIKPLNPKGNQLWIFIGRTAAEAPYFGHLMERANSVKDPQARKDGRQKEKRVIEGRRWNGWMTSPKLWIWISANSGR